MEKQLVNQFVGLQPTDKILLGYNARLIKIEAEVDIVVGHWANHNIVVVVVTLHVRLA